MFVHVLVDLVIGVSLNNGCGWKRDGVGTVSTLGIEVMTGVKERDVLRLQSLNGEWTGIRALSVITLLRLLRRTSSCDTFTIITFGIRKRGFGRVEYVLIFLYN